MNNKMRQLNLLTSPVLLLFLLCGLASAQQQQPSPAPATPGVNPAQPAAPTVPAVPTTPTAPPVPAVQNPSTPPPAVDNYLKQKIQLTAPGRTFYISRAVLGFYDSGTAPLRASVDQNELTKALNRLKLRLDSGPTSAHPVLVTPLTHQISIKIDSTPRPATIVPAEPEVKLLVQQSVANITSTIATQPNTTVFPLVVQTGKPAPASPDLNGIDSRVSHFVTHYDPYEVGRTVTVKRAIQLCDGYVVEPGEIFSLNDVVGVRTVARGFGIGKVFINGTMQDQVGGGMCQVATTLYNAALLANLKIVERHAHARTVPYVPAGADATVYFGEKDFKFQNNTQTPIYISYKTRGDYCICDLYGKGNPDVKVRVVDVPTRLGERYYKGVLRRYVTVDGKTTNDYTSYSSYQWTPALDYLP